MAKQLICMFTVFFACLKCVSMAEITNVQQCINVELTPSILSQIPDMDCTTPQASVLGFVKGVVTGNFLTFLWPLSDAVRVRESGVSDLSLVTPSMTNQFLEFVSDSGFSNHFVCAYSEIQTNGAVHATISVRSRSGLLVKTNDVKTILQTSNGLWRIVEWDVDE